MEKHAVKSFVKISLVNNATQKNNTQKSEKCSNFRFCAVWK